MVLACCLAFLVLLGLVERAATSRARRAVPIRIHVNGTRGKSTVTRLIAAALRSADIRTVAKVTGTAPRLILSDGSEQPIVRRAPANIREQLWLVRRAARAGARALVVECMAVRPELQRASEREMVRATIGVITNVRRDHTDVMGESIDEICASLSNTIPRGGVLVAGDARLAASLAPRCAALGTRIVVAGSPGLKAGTYDPVSDGGTGVRRFRASARDADWFDRDVAIALAVTRELGVDDEVALRGMRRAASDPGATARGVATVGGREIAWLDATAANDPESLDLIVSSTVPVGQGFSLAVYNHRADRPDRLRAFARFSATIRRAAAIVLTGDRPSLTLLASVRRLCPDARVQFVPMHRLEAAIGGGQAAVIFCGNTRGFVRPCWKPPSASASPSTCC